MSKEILQQETDLNKFSRLVAPVILWLANHLRVDIEGRDNLVVLREHLMSGSAMLPFNHPSLPDPLLVYRVIEEELGENVDRIVIPASEKFFDGRMGLIGGAVVSYLNKRTKVQAFPVTQFYAKDDGMSSAIRNMGVVRRMIGVLREKRTILTLSPEGTRSDKASMKKAEGGLSLLIRIAERRNINVMVGPIAIIGSEGINKKGSRVFNLFHKVRVVVGTPMKVAELMEEAKRLDIDVGDVVMLHLAELLPEEYRGYYSFSQFSQFFKRD